MATTASEIYDLFMLTVTDYRLTTLFNESVDDFETYLESFLKFAITDFVVCDQALVYDDTTNVFSVDLESYNKTILAKLMMKAWLQKEVNNITQMSLHVTDRDFRVASEAANLREKSAYLNTVKEDVSQLLIDYGYRKSADWTNWKNQLFDED